MEKPTKNQEYITVKQLLKDLEETKAIFFHDQYNEAFIAIGGNGRKIIKLSSNEFKQWLSRCSWTKYKQAPSPNTIAKVVQTLIGKAKFDGPQHRLDVRTAYKDNAIWYDCGASKAVCITKDGWSFTEELPIVFRRFQHQKKQVEPEVGGNIGLLEKYINLSSNNDKLLFAIYVVAAFIPGYPHPILILNGPQGAGKSTPMRVMKELIDPSAIRGVSAPGDVNAFAQLAHHHAFLFFDNLSMMPLWFSDALARISTGDGFSKRALYSDDDDIVYDLQKTIALNGINQVVTKADLLDRSILLTLERIEPSKRRSEEAFWKEFESERSKILGAIFDIISKALAILPDVKLKNLPRMADFSRWGYAIAEAADIGGENFIAAYRANIERQNEEAIEASPVAQAVLQFMTIREDWEGTASELLSALNHLVFNTEFSKSPLWPKDPQWLTKRLNEVQPNLSARGVEFTRYTSGEGRITRITKTTDSSVDSVDIPPEWNDSKTVETVINEPPQQGLAL